MPRADLGGRLLLLDTHVWVWLMQGDATLRRVRGLLDALEQSVEKAFAKKP